MALSQAPKANYGIRTVKRVPCSFDSTLMLPWCAMAMHLQMYRPRPMLAASPLRFGKLARLSGSNSVGNAFSGMGFPSLDTAIGMNSP